MHWFLVQDIYSAIQIRITYMDDTVAMFILIIILFDKIYTQYFCSHKGHQGG